MAHAPLSTRFLRHTPQTHILGDAHSAPENALQSARAAFLQGRISQAELEQQAQAVEARQWQAQIDAGLSMLTVGDLGFEDAMLSHAARLGVFPQRFADASLGHTLTPLERLFYLAHGQAPQGMACPDVAALQPGKWFDTDADYLIPELSRDQTFTPDYSDLLAQVEHAKHYDRPLKVVVPGLLTFLYLSRIGDPQAEDSAPHTLTLVDRLLPAYAQLFDQLRAAGVSWVQVDEPILVLDLPQAWKSAFERVYHLLQRRDLSLLIASYFGALGENLYLACHLPVAGLHIDTTRELPHQKFWQQVIDQLPVYKILSLGVIDGCSSKASDLSAHSPLNQIVQQAKARLGERLWLASSCSLRHVCSDLAHRQSPVQYEERLTCARLKLAELARLAQLAALPIERPKKLHSTEYLAY